MAPSADTTGAKLSPFPSTPPGPTDSRVEARALGLLPASADAHEPGQAGHEVVDEDVAGAVAVVGHQRVGVGLEGHQPTVAADRGSDAGPVAHGAMGPDAGQDGRVG